MTEEENLEEIRAVLAGFVSPRRLSALSPNSRLFHDLMIRGDEIAPFWNRFDPEKKIDMRGFVDDEFFPTELSWDALVVDFYSRFGAHSRILRKYKEFTIRDLIELKNGKTWKDIRCGR